MCRRHSYLDRTEYNAQHAKPPCERISAREKKQKNGICCFSIPAGQEIFKCKQHNGWKLRFKTRNVKKVFSLRTIPCTDDIFSHFRCMCNVYALISNLSCSSTRIHNRMKLFRFFYSVVPWRSDRGIRIKCTRNWSLECEIENHERTTKIWCKCVEELTETHRRILTLTFSFLLYFVVAKVPPTSTCKCFLSSFYGVWKHGIYI